MCAELLLTRRQFLALLAAASLATNWFVAGADDPVLTACERSALLAMARTLFPHGPGAEERYRSSVSALDDECRRHPATKKVVCDGIARLGTSFPERTVRQRIRVLKSLETSEFFHTVYKVVLRHVYGDLNSWSIVHAELLAA